MAQSDAIGVAKIKFETIALPPKTEFYVRSIHPCFVEEDACGNTQAVGRN
jgi:hypothetical protein